MHALTAFLAVGILLAGITAAGAAGPPGVASDAHRADPQGAYGGLKSSRPLVRPPNKPSVPMRGAGDVRDQGKKAPYNYRYYSDTDRSPASCRRYAQRAIATNNRNWWTRYRACVR